MPFPVIAIMVCAASLNASWSAIIKGADNKLYMTILMTGGAGVVGALLLPFLARPVPASWPYIAASALCSVVYYSVIAKAYHVGDLSLVYPLMRGTAPLLVALASSLVLGERLSVGAWLGVGLICTGILGLAALSMGRGTRGAGFALGNAAIIACYTLIDGLGVRRSGAPTAYGIWVYVLTTIPMVTWVVFRDRGAFGRYAAQRPLLGALGGVMAVATYSATLWAMTVAPVAMVAALRESSILFVVVISAWVLKERVDGRRLALVCAIAGGAMVLRLA